MVCADWLEDGAAVDWIYVAMTNWMFQVGTNAVDRLRVYSFGKVETGGPRFVAADAYGTKPVPKVETGGPRFVAADADGAKPVPLPEDSGIG